MHGALPGGIPSRPSTPSSVRRTSVSDAGPESPSGLRPEADPGPQGAGPADPAAPAGSAGLAVGAVAAVPEAGAEAPAQVQVQVQGQAEDRRKWPTGKAAAALGALVSGVHQLVAQGVGVVGRAGFQTGMALWAGSALRTQAPASRPPAPPESPKGNGTDSADGAGSADSGAGKQEGSVDGSSGDLPAGPTLRNQTGTGNITFFGNETQRWNGTDPWVSGDPGNQTRPDPAGQLGNGTQADAPADGSVDTDPATLAEAGVIEVLPQRPGSGPIGVSLPPLDSMTALAGSVTAAQAGLVPPDASLPAPAALPGAMHMGGLDYQASPALWGPIGLSGAILAASVLLSASRVWDLGRGALAAIRKWDPQSPEGRRRGGCLVGAMGLMASLGPVGYALSFDTQKARGPDARMMMAAWLLINAAGRTCQNLLRDTFTQGTRGLLPSLQFSVPAEGGAEAKSGTPTFTRLHLNPRVLGLRVGLTLASYWAGVYFCMAHLTPAVRQAMGTHKFDLGVQAEHHLGSLEVFLASLPPLVGSAVAEGMDSFTASLSASASVGYAGARIEMVGPEGRPSWSKFVKGLRDNVTLRFLSSISTVDLERAVSTLVGLNRDSPAGVALTSFATSLTDLRGFGVLFALHQEAAQAAQQPIVVLPLEPVGVELASLSQADFPAMAGVHDPDSDSDSDVEPAGAPAPAVRLHL